MIFQYKSLSAPVSDDLVNYFVKKTERQKPGTQRPLKHLFSSTLFRQSREKT